MMSRRNAATTKPLNRLRLEIISSLLRVQGPFRKSAEEFLQRLLEVNISRVENDFFHRIETSRIEFQGALTDALQQTVKHAEDATRHAEQILSQGQKGVDLELAMLHELQLELTPGL